MTNSKFNRRILRYVLRQLVAVIILTFGTSCYDDYKVDDMLVWETFESVSQESLANGYCISEDTDGSINFGTDNGMCWFTNGWSASLKGSTITDLFINETVFLAAINLKAYNLDRVTGYFERISNAPQRVVSLYFDGIQNWFGTLDGLYLGTSTITKFPDISGQIWNINDLGENKIGISTQEEGFIIIKNNQISKRYNLENGLPSNNVLTSFKDSKSRLWIGLGDNHGLCEITEQGVKQFNFPEIDGIAEDQQGNLWLASSANGVYKWEANGNIINYTLMEGLPDTFVDDILVSSTNEIWVVTKKGIARFKPNSDIQ